MEVLKRNPEALKPIRNWAQLLESGICTPMALDTLAPARSQSTARDTLERSLAWQSGALHRGGKLAGHVSYPFEPMPPTQRSWLLRVDTSTGHFDEIMSVLPLQGLPVLSVLFNCFFWRNPPNHPTPARLALVLYLKSQHYASTPPSRLRSCVRTERPRSGPGDW